MSIAIGSMNHLKSDWVTAAAAGTKLPFVSNCTPHTTHTHTQTTHCTLFKEQATHTTLPHHHTLSCFKVHTTYRIQLPPKINFSSVFTHTPLSSSSHWCRCGKCLNAIIFLFHLHPVTAFRPLNKYTVDCHHSQLLTGWTWKKKKSESA